MPLAYASTVYSTDKDFHAPLRLSFNNFDDLLNFWFMTQMT